MGRIGQGRGLRASLFAFVALGVLAYPGAAYGDHGGYGDGRERSRCQGYDCRDGGSGNEGEHRDDNRRAGISPGPFDRSPVDFRDNRVTICFPFARCDSKGEEGGEGDNPPRQPVIDPNPACLISVPYHCDKPE